MKLITHTFKMNIYSKRGWFTDARWEYNKNWGRELVMTLFWVALVFIAFTANK